MATVFDRGLNAARTTFDNTPAMTPEEQQANAVRNYTATTGAFGQGLTRGTRGLKAGLNNALGTALEVAGANDSAQQAYQDAAHQSELAAAESPDIPRLNQVNDLASGARFIAGQAGAGLPYVAPAVVSTTGARMLGAGAGTSAAAGVAANVAPMVGNVQERLRADPVTAALPASQRAAIAAGEGLTDAALYEIAPAAMAGRAVGATRVASPSLNPLNTVGRVAKDTAATSAAMGAAGAGSEVLGQHVQSELNPNRDTSGDLDSTIEAGVGGAAGMLPLAVPHAIAAHTVGATRSAVREGLPDVADAAGNAVDKGRSWIQKRLDRSQDSDYNTLHDPQVLPPGTSKEAADTWLTQDDAARNQAAERMAQRYAADPEAPVSVQKAAADYLNGPKTDDSWSALAKASKIEQRVSAVKDGLNNLADRLNRGVQGAKDALNNRENAQNVNNLADGGFDSLLADKLFQHTGLDSSDQILNTLPGAVQGTKSWIENGFALKPGGEVTVPHGFVEAFKNPVQAATDAYDLMRKQGLVKDDPAKLKEVTTEIENHLEARKSDGSIVEDNLLPTTQAKHKFSGADHQQIALEVKHMISSGKLNETVLDELFGPNKEKVLEALDRNREKPTFDVQKEGSKTVDHNESADLEDKLNPNVVEPTVEYHGPYKAGEKESPAEVHARNLEGTLKTAYGRDVKRVGYVDALRERYADNPAKFAQALTDFIAKHKADLATDAEKAHPEEALNKKHFVLRSEDAGDKVDSIDIPGRELNVITPDSGSNKWAERTGKNNEYGDVGHGKVFFERLKYDGKGKVDTETGEAGPSVSAFATSTNKLISRMRAAKKDGAFVGDNRGVLDQHDMLRAGIASMLSAKDSDGRPVTSGRIGVVDKPGDKVRWLGPNDKLPDGLKLPSGHTIKDVATESKALRVQQLKDSLQPFKGDEKIAEALKGDDESALRSLVDKHVKDSFGENDHKAKEIATVSETKIVGKAVDKETGAQSHVLRTETKHLSESEEMAAAGNDKPRTHDELTGEELHPKTRPTEKPLPTPKQVEFAKNELEKGVPAFLKTVSTLDTNKLAAVKNLLVDLGKAGKVDPIWRDAPPADMAQFKQRVKAALARLEGSEPTKPVTEKQVVKQFNEQSSFGPVNDKPMSEAEKTSIRADVAKRLGKDVSVEFADKILGSKGAEISGDWQEGLIRVSIRAADPAGVGAHESYHEFFSRLNKSDLKDAGRVKDILSKAASSAPVLRQIERLLDGHSSALEQIKDGTPNALEERQAYMYQFWRAGLLKVGPETKATFQKIADFFRSVVGKLSNDQKAEKLLEAFDEGKTQTADAAAEVLAKNIEYRENLINGAFDTIKPVTDKLARFTLPSEAILMRSENPHLQAILRDFKNPTGEGVAQSMIEAKGQKMAQYMNRFQALVGKYEPKDLELASKYLHEGTAPTDRVAKEVYEGVHAILDDMDTYMREAGVKRLDDESKKWVDFGHRENYYPQAYDVGAISKDSAAFAKDLIDNHRGKLEAIAKQANKEKDSGADVPNSYASALAKNKSAGEPITVEDVANAITNRIINAYGHTDISESTSDIGFSPNARAVNQRTLDWLDKKAMSKWMNHDMVNVMTSYIAQGVKRAEYVRRFDNGGEKLSANVEKAFQYEQEKAKERGLSSDEAEKAALKNLEGPTKSIMALEGTLGYDIDPRLRRLQGTLMAYENLRTMGLSLFSAVIDPLGIMVRGGTMKDAFDSYGRSLKEVWSTWKGEHTQDRDAMLAEMLGTVDSGGFLANFGQAYSSLYLHQKVRKWNEALFHWNGMDGFNRGVRIQATQAAISFIKRQVTDPTEHSKRYLDELVLKPEDVKINKDGDLDYSNPKIQVAVKRWVDQAILRPNAAHRPTWMSDPHFAIFGHMKQFSYTFHDTIMKRAWMEAKEHSNLAPMAVLLGAFTPMMVAADLAKSILLTGDTPVWAKEGLPSMIDHGARRAGLLGLAQPYADPLVTGHPFSMAGPTVEQATSLFTQPFSESMVDALPLSSVINTMNGGGHIELMADD